MTRRAIDELGDLLERPYCAVLATYREDGTALLSPVWHEWRDGGFNIGIPEGDIKHQHLLRDPRAAVVVYDHHWPARGIEVRGLATLGTEDSLEVSRRLSIRYLGPVNGERYAAKVTPGIVVRVEPGKVRAWDFVDEIAPDPTIAMWPTPDPV
jgi:PPOX class probable F420-dependent enzyme